MRVKREKSKDRTGRRIEREGLASALPTMVLALSARSADHPIIVSLKRKYAPDQLSRTPKLRPSVPDQFLPVSIGR